MGSFWPPYGPPAAAGGRVVCSLSPGTPNGSPRCGGGTGATVEGPSVALFAVPLRQGDRDSRWHGNDREIATEPSRQPGMVRLWPGSGCGPIHPCQGSASWRRLKTARPSVQRAARGVALGSRGVVATLPPSPLQLPAPGSRRLVGVGDGGYAAATHPTTIGVGITVIGTGCCWAPASHPTVTGAAATVIGLTAARVL